MKTICRVKSMGIVPSSVCGEILLEKGLTVAFCVSVNRISNIFSSYGKDSRAHVLMLN